ncbi:hypothetical protein JHK85_010884 [Glycine max]|nr:hypothetical protein JHK85_010884 [Glycine max]
MGYLTEYHYEISIRRCYSSFPDLSQHVPPLVVDKEVSRLRGLVGGGEIQDNDILVVNFPGSPGSFKWEGVQGSFTPLTSVKRISQKKDYDIALVGAFRREKDKEMELQALRDEIQASMKLVRQREDDIQSLKMRLRFREAGIKRLQTDASEKISAETHLLKEKEEHLKEIEVLRAQVDRNNEATTFAMENLQLKEEIRRHLLEALDWKFMHETDLVRVQVFTFLVLHPTALFNSKMMIRSSSGWDKDLYNCQSYQRSFCSPNLTGHAKFDAERVRVLQLEDKKHKLRTRESSEL